MKRLEFHISYNCVNDCFFCSEYDRMEQFKKNPVSFKEIKKELILKRKAGFDFVNFTGGEPTIHPDFLEIIKFAKKLDYKIYIGTNGCMLAKKDFCKQATPFLDEISFSIHGHDADLHDKLVGRRGAFADIVAAIDNVGSFDFVNKFANIVTIKDNFDHLEEILEFLGKHKFLQVLFSNLAPEGMGFKKYKQLSVHVVDWRKKIPKLLKISKNYSMNLRFFGLPICALGDARLLSNDMFWDSRMTVERGVDDEKNIILSEIKDLHPTRNRIKTDICKKCLYSNLCCGVFAEYVKNFGSKELKAFKNEK